ncbi:unnamed protein product [Boreogadus saida]
MTHLKTVCFVDRGRIKNDIPGCSTFVLCKVKYYFVRNIEEIKVSSLGRSLHFSADALPSPFTEGGEGNGPGQQSLSSTHSRVFPSSSSVLPAHRLTSSVVVLI